MKLRAAAADYWAGVNILIQDYDNGKRAVVKTLTLETVEDGNVVEPTLRLSMDEAQALMDDLWTSGLRPTEGTGSAGSLKATQNHLADMRQLVAHKLGVKLGG